MARGFDSAREAIAEIEARRAGGGNFGQFFKLAKSGDFAYVRFIDKEIDWVWVHDLPKDNPNAYTKTEICRNQDLETGQRNGEPCEGCEKDYRRKMSGTVRLIQRDAPVYATDENGKKDYDTVVGAEDQVVRWSVGKVVIEELDGKAATYKDLTKRDFKVTRSGTGLGTTYSIEPVVNEDGDPIKTPLSENDEKLIEEAAPVEFKIPSYEEWGKGKKGGGGSSKEAPASVDASPFSRKRD